jgi:hypothetical protein
MERDKYWLVENIVDDIFRHAKSLAKYAVVFALWLFSSQYVHQPLGEVTCMHQVTVQLTWSTTFVVPSALPTVLPRTWAQ